MSSLNPSIPCEFCNQNVEHDDYIEHLEICQNRSNVLNLLNPMLNRFLQDNREEGSSWAGTNNDVNLEEFADEFQMNSIIAEFIGTVHNGVEDIDKAMTEVSLDKVVNDNLSCIICLEPFNSTDTKTAVQMTCNHHFHGCCISKWLKENHKCPLCLYDFNI